MNYISNENAFEEQIEELFDEILILPNQKLSGFFFKDLDLVDFDDGEMSCLLCSVPSEFTDENIKGLLRVRNIGGKPNYYLYIRS